jgi:hypothetical protein
MSAQRIHNKLIEKLLRKQVTGGHKKQVDTVVSWFPSSDQGDVKNAIDDMAKDPTAPIERYGGGHRENIRLSSIGDAVDYLEANGGNVPFGFGDDETLG